jgi:hypothetical protein
MTLMRPPVLTRPFPARAGYALFAVVPVLAYVVALLLPADASIWGFELDALLVDLVLLFWFAHAVLMIASRPVRRPTSRRRGRRASSAPSRCSPS